MGRGLAALVIVALGGAPACRREPAGREAAPGSAAMVEARRVAGPAPPATPVVDATVPPPPPAPPLCEVEIRGHVKVPRSAGTVPAPLVFVARGDCLAEAPAIVGYGGTTGGRLFVEVFVPWGSDLTLCAASEPSPGAPSRLYGKARGGVHVEGYREVEWEDVQVTLAPGPPRRFPHGPVAPGIGPP